jgi:predicted nuclease of predicted toxin-antitoxin system
MKILIDMNLSSKWVEALVEAGHEPVHWATVGSPSAADDELMAWALEHEFVVLTFDLDFGSILAATHAQGPSVIQLRSQDVTPDVFREMIFHVLRESEQELRRGALISIDRNRHRVRVLPVLHDKMEPD